MIKDDDIYARAVSAILYAAAYILEAARQAKCVGGTCPHLTTSRP